MLVEVRENFDVKNLTSFKIGGKISKVYFPKSVEEFEEILGIYWGECAIKYNSSSIWIVEEDWLINGKYSFCINIKGWMHITYKYFNDLYKYPDNKTHKRMYREFKKMVMD